MSFTDHCDIYAAFHEEGFNQIIRHVMSQRPSLFNFGTAEFLQRPSSFCVEPKPHFIVAKRNNPVATKVDPLPIPGTNYGAQFCAQVVDVQIDFHPEKLFQLPPEMDPPLKDQHFAIRVKVCGGIGCPPGKRLDALIPPPPDERKEGRPKDQRDPIMPLPFDEVHCFCVEAFVTGVAIFQTYNSRPYFELRLERFEIVDIKPEGLENSLECYISMVLRLYVLPGLRFLAERTIFKIDQFVQHAVSVTITPTPVSGSVPHNPALEDDQAKLHFNLIIS